MSKFQERMIFLFGKNRKTRFSRILLTLVILTFLALLLFGVTLDLGPVKVAPVADININK